MNNKTKNFFLILLILIGIFSVLFQYVKTFQSEIASAYQANKPAAGHNWQEMQCTSDLCVDTANHRVGIGTDLPSQSLEVEGNILSTGDVCNGEGACLSDIASFVGSQPLVSSVHTQDNCTSAGGSIVDVGVAYPLCRFNSSSCPSGWTQYQNFSATASFSVVASGTGGSCSTSTGSHAWSNTAIESACATLYYIDPGFMQGGSCTTISSSSSDNYYSCSPSSNGCGTSTAASQCSNATVLNIGCY